MRSLAGFFRFLTHALGAQRRLVRRVGALCLVLMGVHLAADHLDDIVYGVIDAADLAVDDTVAGFLDWLAGHGGLKPEAALHAAASFASLVDLAEKDKLSLVISLLCELLLDVLLFGLAWGRHQDGEPGSLRDELKASARQMKEALLPLDLERLAALPTLFCYAFGGAVTSALAVENAVRGAVQRGAPDFAWAGPAGAGCGILAAALLAWRFLPDLLHGALLQSRARHDRARERLLERARAKSTTPRFPRLAAATLLARLHTRGLWIVVVALPLAVSGLLSHDLFGLLQRVQVMP